MVLTTLAVGGVAAGGAKMFTYNREGWLNDVQVNQARRYQKQQVRLSQAEMFREDIRDLANASVTRHNNYVLIGTLILGMIGECFIEGPLPSGTAEFVQSAYLLCVGSSLLYMVLSLRCAIGALHLANTCQKDLLTTLVRLPVDEFVEEIDIAARVESAEAFEHQSWEAMFRMPGLSRLQPPAPPAAKPAAAAAAAAASEQLPKFTPVVADGTPMQHAEPGRSPNGAASASAGDRWPGATEEEDAQAKKAELHLAVFHEREREWEVLGNLAYVLGALGISSLLQAYGYFAAAKYYEGYTWASWAVQLLLVLVDGLFAAAYMTELPYATFVAAFLSLVGPMSCSLAIRSSEPLWIDVVCIPLCFFCHFVWNTLGFMQMLKIVHAAALAESESPEVPIDSFTEAACIRRDAHNEAAANPNANRRSLSAVGKRKRRQLSRSFIGSALVMLAWLSTICWALYHAVRGDGDDGTVEPSARRLLEGRTAAVAAARTGAAPLPALREVNATWPAPRFRPHAIACAGDSTCFVANDFVIFQFDPQTGRAPAAPVQCEMRVPILDMAAARSEEGPWPMVLARSASGSFVTDCLEGSSQPSPLGGGTDAQRLAARGGDELFAVHGGTVLQHARDGLRGWRPEWPVASAAGGDLAAVDLAPGSGSLVLFYASGRVEILDTDSGAVCGEWQLPVERRRVLSAAVLGPAAAVLLLGHAETKRGGGGPAVSVQVADLAGALNSCASQGPLPGGGATREGGRLRR